MTVTAGSIRFNTDSSKLEIYNGDKWWNIDSTSPQEQTGGTRGIIGGGNNSPGGNSTDIEYITISSTGNAEDFGDFPAAQLAGGMVASRTRAIYGGGQWPAAPNNDHLSYVTIASKGDMVDFGGDLTANRDFLSALSDSTRGIFAGGRDTPAATDVMDYITMASTGVDAQDFGNLSAAVLYYPMTCASPTRGIITGGSPLMSNHIDYITISSKGHAADFGDTSGGHSGGQGCSNTIRGIFGGGYIANSTKTNILDYITITTLGNAVNFGDLTQARRGLAACASSTRGVWAGGMWPADHNIIDYVHIMTTGNAIDFGDLAQSHSGKQRNKAACSNGHGGLG